MTKKNGKKNISADIAPSAETVDAGEIKDYADGYMPHAGMKVVRCECGCDRFRYDPQSIDPNSRVWCFEHICMRCGRMIGINVVKS